MGKSEESLIFYIESQGLIFVTVFWMIFKKRIIGSLLFFQTMQLSIPFQARRHG